MIPLADVHCHLDAPEFAGEVDDVITRALAAGVRSMVSNGTNPASNRAVLALCAKHPQVKAALGFYPNDAVALGLRAVHQEMAFIKEQAAAHPSRVAALGEVGLDKFTDSSVESFRIMTETLTLFARLSRQIGKPLIVHTRKAEEETIELLEREGVKKAVFHCFGGGKKLAMRIIKNGWYLSIPANVTRSDQFQTFVRESPLAQLLTETDSPFLSPDSRGVRNEPASVARAIPTIAKLKGLTVEETANQLYMNYQRVFLV